jgi:hypothetical protein
VQVVAATFDKITSSCGEAPKDELPTTDAFTKSIQDAVKEPLQRLKGMVLGFC